MKSKAHFQGHPIHPMLVAFPIAFIYGSFVADAAALAGNWRSVAATGAYLSMAAVVTGLAAGVPGLIDYLYAVPPKSSGKQRATWHMAVNVTALVAIALGWAFRDWSTLAPGIATVLLGLAAVGLVTWGGWMGGTLVYRNQIGVDHRHAHAGKWKEEAIDVRPGEPVVVAKADELKPGQMKLLLAGRRRIVLARTDEGYAAFDDRCTHRGGPLADGVLICSTVACPWHGSRFDAASGDVQAGPAEKPIGAYEVTLSGDDVRLTLPE